jgi:hypothetical protein
MAGGVCEMDLMQLVIGSMGVVALLLIFEELKSIKNILAKK